MEKIAVVFWSLILCGISGCTVGTFFERADTERPVVSTSSQSYEEDEIKSLDTIYFDYDKSNINPSDIAKFKILSEDLKKDSSLKVRIEGHCDERGTREYNLSLGERRANSVREILIINGISNNRIITVSYGEERPVSAGSNEVSWSKNRRALIKIF